MFSTAILVFREVFEAALIISIVLAASKGLAKRNQWVLGGIGMGVLGALLVAAAAEAIAAAIEGVGQEIFNASVLLIAVAMLCWHNIWMKQHGREMAQQINQVGQRARSGETPLYVMAIAVALAVLREGSEVVLFLYGVAAAGSDTAQMFTGGLIGLGSGIVVSSLLYLGLLRIPTQYLFGVTSWLIIFLAAGMSAQAANFLVQAGWLPELISEVWDSSALLPQQSIIGQLLHALIGYDERPMGIQLAFYVGTMTVVIAAMRWVDHSSEKNSVKAQLDAV